MKLFGYHRSSAAYRVRIALNLKALQYEYIGVNLVKGEQRSEAHLARNPQGLVPTLETANGAKISQSTAILDWLEDEFPDPALYPQDNLARAAVRSMTNTISCDIHPLNNLRVLKYLVSDLDADDAQKTSWYQHWIALGFASIESQLNSSSFCFGEEVSMADAYLIPQVYNALRFKQDMAAYPNIMATYHHCNQLQAFKDAAPEAQPDAS